MKISKISTFSNQQNKTRNQNFCGYVNGKFYRDEVINEARNALKNPEWKEKIIARKRTLGETLSTWHEREGSNDLATRILMGIFTLGLTELTWGAAHRIMDASDNKEIDNLIKEIEECIVDLENDDNSQSGIEG